MAAICRVLQQEVSHTALKKGVHALKLAVQELFLASASTWLQCPCAEIQSQALAQNNYLNKKHLPTLITKIKHPYCESDQEPSTP